MSTNHNRIRVADLEKNQPNKILKTNQNGELEFSNVNDLQAESYNALDCTAEGKTLDARQGKVLKDMIDNIPSGVSSVTGAGVNNTDPKNPIIQAASATQAGVINTISLQELGGVDKYINGVRIGRGSGNFSNNTALGANSLTSNNFGSFNTAVGYSTLSLNTGGSKNTAIGFSSLYFNTGSNNTAIGYNSLIVNRTGSFNIGIGSETLSVNSGGNDNLGLGNYALKSNTEGNSNIAIGKYAGGNITTGNNNTFITNGNSPINISTGNNNTIIGGYSSGFNANDSNLVILGDGTGNIAIRKEADNRLLAPTLTNALIESGGNKSLITKDYLMSELASKLTATIANDVETQINTSVSEDGKVISRSKLFNWWKWVKSQTQTISGMWNFTNKVTFASSTATTPSLIIPSGTLTTIPQNGAIERDENGQLWETHGNVRSKIGNGWGSIELKGEFNSNGAALAANLKVGDYYSLPICDNSQASCIAVVKSLPAKLFLNFSNIEAVVASLGIDHKNSIDNWNAYFTSKNSCNFDSVEIIGNQAKFILNDSSLLKAIKLPNTQITYAALSNSNHITDIDLSNNELQYFIDLESMPNNLVNFNLSNNKISYYYTPAAFPNTLKQLNLSGNKFTEFLPNYDLPDSISELDLEGNLIEVIEDNVHMPLNLKTLNLNNNLLSDFSIDIPKNLETLLLSGNRLFDFKTDAVQHRNLRLLDLSHNEFSRFDPWYGLPDEIEVLKLSHNGMTDFDPQSLPVRLKRLELNDNDIEIFEPYHFAEYLEVLMLQNNKIVNFNPKNLNDNLSELILSNNKIVNFKPEWLPSELVVLSLENNPITTASWNTNIDWCEGRSENGILYAGNTAGSINGTNTESLLKELNWTILKTPYSL